MNRPFSAACERNKAPILEQLRALYAQRRSVLEIGSGTGQHALHFAAALPQLVWQCSEIADNLSVLRLGLELGLEETGLSNVPPPQELDVTRPWPAGRYQAVYTANTLHIMGWPQVQSLFAALPQALDDAGLFTAYGPFNRGGQFSSQSNREFDAALRAADPQRGIRDFEAVDALAAAAGLQLQADVAMPANNRLLTWCRRSMGQAPGQVESRVEKGMR